MIGHWVCDVGGNCSAARAKAANTPPCRQTFALKHRRSYYDRTKPTLHSEFVGRPPATLEKRIPINNTSIPRAFQRLQVQRGSSAVHATGRCGAANEKRHAAEACRRMPTASRTLMIVERLGLPSALSARYKLSRLSPESRATLLIPRARAISPSARAMPVASSGASASHASRYAAISFGVRNCAAMS